MKNYTETERRAHVENWKSGRLSKAAYAKSAGIVPTTFYTWIRHTERNGQTFVELDRRSIPGNARNMTVKKGGITINLPLSTGMKELQTIFEALGTIS